MATAVRPAAQSDLATAARTLALAFDSYPWTRWVVPADDHANRLTEIQMLYLEFAHQHGMVIVDDEVRSVAAFLPPGAPEPDHRTQARIAELHGDRLPALLALSLPDAPVGAWSLATVGVDPRCQGVGLGSAILSAGLTRIDEQRAPVHLETSDERNLALYGRFGFVTTATTEIPDGPVVHTMLRDPAETG